MTRIESEKEYSLREKIVRVEPAETLSEAVGRNREIRKRYLPNLHDAHSRLANERDQADEHMVHYVGHSIISEINDINFRSAPQWRRKLVVGNRKEFPFLSAKRLKVLGHHASHFVRDEKVHGAGGSEFHPEKGVVFAPSNTEAEVFEDKEQF